MERFQSALLVAVTLPLLPDSVTLLAFVTLAEPSAKATDQPLAAVVPLFFSVTFAKYPVFHWLTDNVTTTELLETVVSCSVASPAVSSGKGPPLHAVKPSANKPAAVNDRRTCIMCITSRCGWSHAT
jgi:hypothetical protein